MNCPSCGGTKFEKIGNSVYCVTKVNGRLCGVTLKGDLRRKYFEKYATHKDRKKYWNDYYHRKRRKYRDGISISEVAAIKFCTVQCVHKHLKLFDIINKSMPLMIKFNNKLLEWNPKNVKHKN